MTEAAAEVGPALFFCLLIITLSFIPVFTLQAQEGRMFKPLAFTKTYSMGAAALLSITLAPVLMGFFIRGKIPKEKVPRSLEQRLKSLELTSTDPDVQERAKVLRNRVRA